MKTVWYVQGADPDEFMPKLFATKMAAEIYARQVFPTLSIDQQYARVYYRNVWEESDLT
jgi:hypothetical protein